MSTNFGFENFTFKGSKIDLNQLKKYDTSNDGSLDIDEYNTMVSKLNSKESDGFNGVSAFGSESTTIAENETGIKSGINRAVQTFKNVIIPKLSPEQRAAKKAAQQAAQAAAAAQTTSTPASTSASTTQTTTSTPAPISTPTTQTTTTTTSGSTPTTRTQAEIDAEARLATLKTDAQALGIRVEAGDTIASLQTKIDKKKSELETQLTNLKTDAQELGITVEADDTITSLKNKITAKKTELATQLSTLKKDAQALGITIEASDNIASLQTKIAAKKLNKDTLASYKVDGLNLDYSQISQYKENGHIDTKAENWRDDYTKATDTSIAEAKGLAKAEIEKIKVQMKDQIKNQCTAKGISFNEELFNNIFNSAEESAVNSSVTESHDDKHCSGGFMGLSDYYWDRKSTSTFRTRDLMTNFVNAFNNQMNDALTKMLSTPSTASGVPTKEAISTDLLTKPDAGLTETEKALKKLQKELLTSGDKVSSRDRAVSIIDTISNGVKTRMKNSLGDKYKENKANNVAISVKDAVLAEITGSTTEMDVIDKFLSKFQAGYTS